MSIKQEIAKLQKIREDQVLIAMLEGTQTAKKIADLIGLSSGREISSILRSLTEQALIYSNARGLKGTVKLEYWLSSEGIEVALDLKKG